MLELLIRALATTFTQLAPPPVVEKWTRAFDELNKATVKLFEEVNQICLKVERELTEVPTCPGYQALLIKACRYPFFIARLQGLLIIRFGEAVANDAARLPAAVRAMRFLAKPGGSRNVVKKHIAVLLAAWNETSVVDRMFRDSDEESEFVGLLKQAMAGNQTVYVRIGEIAAALAPYLNIPHGPKVTAASAAHECFFEVVGATGCRPIVTWNSYKIAFTDSLTTATREAFGLSHFDPRPARRRLLLQDRGGPATSADAGFLVPEFKKLAN